jgi:hypothetical protein
MSSSGFEVTVPREVMRRLSMADAEIARLSE